MNRFETLEKLERDAVLYLRCPHGSRFAHRLTAEELVRLLNSLVIRWGCHYTVSVESLRTRTGNNPYSFTET